MDRRTMRLVQVGLSGWGMNWATEIIPQVESVAVVGYVFRDPSRLAEIRKQCPNQSVPFFPSLGDAIADTDADGVLVLTKTDAHFALTAQALALNRHVLVEKPFVPVAKDGIALVETAEERGLTLMVNQNFRFFPAARRAAEIVRSAELGALSSITISFNKTMAYLDPEHARRHHQMRHPLLMDLAIHHFDLMRMVIGAEPVSVHCAHWNLERSPFRDPANATAAITFDNGVMVSWRGSWEGRGRQTTFSGDWLMQFEKAEVDWACRGDRDVSLDGDRLHVIESPGVSRPDNLQQPRLFGRAAALDAFAAAAINGTVGRFFPDGRDNLRSIQLMEAALRSAQTGDVISIRNHNATESRNSPLRQQCAGGR